MLAQIVTLISLVLQILTTPVVIQDRAYAHRIDGEASWYESGTTTACGDRYDPDALTVALGAKYFSRSLCGSEIRITFRDTVVLATITDRMPANHRIVDLSRGTAKALGVTGIGDVTIEY